MRILIIESEQAESEHLKQNLTKECFSIDQASTVSRGLFLAHHCQYDAIIASHELVQIHGLEICKVLREKNAQVPILILSGKIDTTLKVSYLNSGADDYLVKPFSFSELVARLRAILRRPKILYQPVLSSADITLDSSRHLVTKAGKQIYLTRKEFELLEYLLKHQGMVLSRSVLMEHVWDIHADIFSNTIETHILNLRRKIDTDKNKKLIQTIPGRGYKLAQSFTTDISNSMKQV